MQITTLARGSRIGNPILAPRTPIRLPTEDRASERWCHASAISAAESIFLAAFLVYQYIPSLTAMEIRAAAMARAPGITSFP